MRQFSDIRDLFKPPPPRQANAKIVEEDRDGYTIMEVMSPMHGRAYVAIGCPSYLIYESDIGEPAKRECRIRLAQAFTRRPPLAQWSRNNLVAKTIEGAVELAGAYEVKCQLMGRRAWG